MQAFGSCIYQDENQRPSQSGICKSILEAKLKHTVTSNILGNPRAEADREMLEKAFYETSEYQALINSEDYKLVVGRRGTGKSALFQKISEFYTDNKRIILRTEVPQEHYALTVIKELEDMGCDYRAGRAISRLIWRGYILNMMAKAIANHYKLKSTESAGKLTTYLTSLPKESAALSFYQFAQVVLGSCTGKNPLDLPSLLASSLDIEFIQEVVRGALEQLNSRGVVLFDSLDEGWLPTAVPTAILGGLARAAVDFADRNCSIHVLAFVRDNVFRSLAHFDPDFSSHIEGADLRLSWDENSLFHLVAHRVRAAFGIDQENNTRVWNRFAKHGIEGRDGFARCLRFTLYRPRDVLSLINRAYVCACRDERSEIIEDDIKSAATIISKERLEDLYREYEVVLPGLRAFVEIFSETKAFWNRAEVLERIAEAINASDFSQPESRDFAVLGNRSEVFLALHSIGFLGIRNTVSGPFLFCHDGASTDSAGLDMGLDVAIHPCYWLALGIEPGIDDIEVITRIDDEHGTGNTHKILDQRMRRLGKVVEELPQITEGLDGAAQFEEWVLRTIRLLFSGHLSNVEIHPNEDDVARRDIVATNSSISGFWRRILEDYKARQVVFELKNYSDLKPPDYNQAYSYSGGIYGSITFIVYRSENEGANENEKSHLLDMYSRHNHLIVLLPAIVLQRCVSKQRSKSREEYWEKALAKRLDTHLRSYLKIRAGIRR